LIPPVQADIVRRNGVAFCDHLWRWQQEVGSAAMRSMTGFGYASGEANGRRCIIELRSFNHRFFDLKLRLPAIWADPLLEQLVGQALRKTVHRGSLIISVREEGPASARQAVQVDLQLGRAYGRALFELWQALREPMGTKEAELPPLGPEAQLQLLSLVAAQPSVLSIGESGMDAERRFRAIESILEQALQSLTAARLREGEALSKDLQQRLRTLGRLLDEISRLVESAPEAHRRRLGERINRLLEGVAVVDAQRLAQEVALLADRLDVTEEITRLRAHMTEFGRLCQSEGLAGRQLDFLTQEMSREVNTIGAKSQSSDVASRVVAMKAELERLREQIQNVE
jgi:uncharacterized protein (TIGR00255 family)